MRALLCRKPMPSSPTTGVAVPFPIGTLSVQPLDFGYPEKFGTAHQILPSKYPHYGVLLAISVHMCLCCSYYIQAL